MKAALLCFGVKARGIMGISEDTGRNVSRASCYRKIWKAGRNRRNEMGQ